MGHSAESEMSINVSSTQGVPKESKTTSAIGRKGKKSARKGNLGITGPEYTL